MRVAALYDIHGNLPALEAVLDDVRRYSVDHIVIGGDVVPGPMPHESLELLRSLETPTRFIRGNGDRVVLARQRGQDVPEVPAQYQPIIWWNADQLTAADASMIAEWPLVLPVPTDIGDVLFCHATPRDDTPIFTRDSSDERLGPLFAEVAEQIVVCGHTHMQFDRRVGSCRVVNAGSVGMPFGEPGAYWLLIDDDVRLQRTSYDLAAAATRIRATQYPDAETFAERNVLCPPSEASMLAAYARFG